MPQTILARCVPAGTGRPARSHRAAPPARRARGEQAGQRTVPQRPYACPFYDHCWQGVDGLTIYDIPRLSAQKERPLHESGVLYLVDIPADCVLTAAQRAFVDFHVKQQIEIDHAAIQQTLTALQYPLYFVRLRDDRLRHPYL